MHLGQVLRVAPDGRLSVSADIAAYVKAHAADFAEGHRPDEDIADSDAYAMILDDDRFIGTDAGANALLAAPMHGDITTLAVFLTFLTPAPPVLKMPSGVKIPVEAAPTGVTKGFDGAYSASALTGHPFPSGATRLGHVVPGQEPTVVAPGLHHHGSPCGHA